MGSDGETILSSSGAICSTCFDDCGMANPPVGMTQVLARHVAPDGVAPADAPLEPFLLHALLFRGDEIGERVAGDVDELMCREELFDRLAWPAADKGEPVADLGVFGAPASVVECFRRGANIEPVPQPMSRASSASPAGRVRSRIRSQAARSAAVRMLWPKSSSKCAARRSQ